MEDAEYRVGYGLKVQTAGRTALVGSVRLMTLEGIVIPADLTEQLLSKNWRSTAKWNESHFQNTDLDALLDQARPLM